MDKYELLKELIIKIEDYEQDSIEKSSLTVDDFIAYVQSNIYIKGDQVETKESEPHLRIANVAHDYYQVKKRLIGQYLTFLSRYAKIYSKKALRDSPFNTIDEFSYLGTLFAHHKLTKTELIEYNIHDKPVGTEIIRRLMAKEMIEEQKNENDKRSQFLVLSTKGQKALFDIFPKMDTVATQIAGVLSENELIQLHYITKKLHHFHNEFFLSKKI
jgi:DNA-binding MarR family transcriptional regulator